MYSARLNVLSFYIAEARIAQILTRQIILKSTLMPWVDGFFDNKLRCLKSYADKYLF